MLKLSHKSTLKPLKLLFENRLRTGIFPDQRKKANVLSIHIKGDEKLVKNYRPFYRAKYLSASFSMTCLNPSEKRIFFLCINQVLFWEIRVSNSLHLSLMRYIKRLIAAVLLKGEVRF